MKLEFTKPLFNRVFIKVILSLGHFSPPCPLFDEVRKVGSFIKSEYEMLKLNI